MGRLLLALIVGIVGAGITHILILLLIPVMSERDAWAQLSSVSDTYAFVPLQAGDDRVSPISSVDPLFQAAACRFDLADGPVRIAAPGKVPFWSASVFDRDSQELYSLTDRALPGTVEFILLDSAQAAVAEEEPVSAASAPIRIPLDTQEGIVVIRAFVPDETWRPSVTSFMSGLSCAVLTDGEAAGAQ